MHRLPAIPTLAHVGEGLWSLEATDRALGRLLQRDPAANLDAVLHAALRARAADVLPIINEAQEAVLLPAGNSVFVCSARLAEDVSAGNEPRCHLTARTWLHSDQLHDDQHALLVDGTAGDRLGESLLLRMPLRRIRTDAGAGGTLSVLSWAPGLPETLAEPAAGREEIAAAGLIKTVWSAGHRPFIMGDGSLYRRWQ